MSTYKTIRGDLPKVVPFWPLGLPGWTDEWPALGIRAPSGPSYVPVWRRGGKTERELPVRHLPRPPGVLLIRLDSASAA
ncbi:hypothetical protein ACQEV2_39360 [Streptomyces sp. CA-251387]|uniref:hypothetical protein n=1 Tax=Streptomyces sp. CA-251387 TaxID=3240064 RepID=UPI003D8C305E